MIRRLLIANRGEIAVRIARACRELGIESTAVYSDADAHALHVRAADRAVRLGPAAAAESYLSVAAIVEAARAAGADAVHPGYGFLAEQPALAAACVEAGLVFVGPPAGVLESMGSKIGARKMMAAAGVPIVPGETPVDQSDAAIARAVERVGFPALVKASAGGGGKGMRVVSTAGGTVENVQAARREAVAAFGDGTLYVERQVVRPHHIEVQVFADRVGHVVHLFERECSVQRRHQKIIEESPSSNLTPGLRRRITETAVRAARAASYLNAGTVEFLVDINAGGGDDTPFYFLEMNTRLQVEHPVTELVTGVDLVRAQMLVASGEGVPWDQDGITQRGHAIEARVYAEDPAQQFLPQAGPLLLYREPRRPGIRIDSGVAEGDVVSVHYDPLLAKVVAHAESRALAARRLSAALADFPVLGIRTNIPFLIQILEHPRFLDGSIDTGFLDTDGSGLASSSPGEVPPWVRSAAAAHAEVRRGAPPQGRGPAAGADDPWNRLTGWRNTNG